MANQKQLEAESEARTAVSNNGDLDVGRHVGQRERVVLHARAATDVAHDDDSDVG